MKLLSSPALRKQIFGKTAVAAILGLAFASCGSINPKDTIPRSQQISYLWSSSENNWPEFDDIRFDFDSAELTNFQKRKIRGILDRVQDKDNFRLTLSGFADPIGEDAYNKDLSIRRAQAVQDYLQERGVPQRDIVVYGYGADDPVSTNPSEYSKDRRVEVKINTPVRSVNL